MTNTDTDTLAPYDPPISICERALDLEETDRGRSDRTIREPLVAFVQAQPRMRVRRALSPDRPDKDAAHIAPLVGTGRGRSTLLNMCLRRAAAGMRITTARRSQYPKACQPAAIGHRWLHAIPSGFAGYEYYRDERPPCNSDTAFASRKYKSRFAVFYPETGGRPAYASPATRQAL